MGKIGCQRNYSPRKQKSTVPSKKTKKCRFNVSPEARTSEILFKPTEEQNHRLTRGLSPVYHRFITGLSAGQEALFVPGCRPVERRLFVSVNPFHARHVREFAHGSRALSKKPLICREVDRSPRHDLPELSRIRSQASHRPGARHLLPHVGTHALHWRKPLAATERTTCGRVMIAEHLRLRYTLFDNWKILATAVRSRGGDIALEWLCKCDYEKLDHMQEALMDF